MHKVADWGFDFETEFKKKKKKKGRKLAMVNKIVNLKLGVMRYMLWIKIMVQSLQYQKQRICVHFQLWTIAWDSLCK